MNVLPASKSFSAVNRCSCSSLKDVQNANYVQVLPDRHLAHAMISTAIKPSTVRSSKKDGSSSSSAKPPKLVYRSVSSDSLLSYYLDGHWPRLMNSTATVCAVHYEQDSQFCKTAAVPNNSSSFEVSKLLIDFQIEETEVQDNSQQSDHYSMKDVENVVDLILRSSTKAGCELDDLCNEEIFSIVQTKLPTDFRNEVAMCVDGHQAPIRHLLIEDGSCGDIDLSLQVPYFHRISDNEDACDRDAEEELAECCGILDLNKSESERAESRDFADFDSPGDRHAECCGDFDSSGDRHAECCGTPVLNAPGTEQAECCGTLELSSLGTKQAECWGTLELNSPGSEQAVFYALGPLSSSRDSKCRPDPEGCESQMFSFVERFTVKSSSIPSPNSAFCKPLRNMPSGLQA